MTLSTHIYVTIQSWLSLVPVIGTSTHTKATTYYSLSGVIFNICIHVHKSIYASKTRKLVKSDFPAYMASTDANTNDVVVWLETKNI